MLYKHTSHNHLIVIHVLYTYICITFNINDMIKIEEIMKKKGVGVTELAERLGVNRQTIYYYMKQGDKNPLSQLQKIADAMDVSVYDIIGEEEKENAIACPYCGKKIHFDGEPRMPEHKNIRGKEYYQ